MIYLELEKQCIYAEEFAEYLALDLSHPRDQTNVDRDFNPLSEMNMRGLITRLW